MDEDFFSEPLGPGNLAYLLSMRCDGATTPDDVRALLKEFVRVIRSKEPIPERLSQFVAAGIAAFLLGEAKSLDHAFGLVGEAHRPEGKYRDRDVLIAVTILKLRLKGRLQEAAEIEAGAEFQRGKTVAQEAWSKNKESAYHIVRVERVVNNRPWLASELEIIEHLFEGEGWYRPPGNSPT